MFIVKRFDGMRVAIVNLTNGGLSGGYLKYLRRIIPYFEHSRQISDLHIFVPPVFSDLRLFRSSKLHTWPTLDLVLGFRKLKQQLRQMDIDVVFFPTARRIDCGAVPTVVMVRNMEPLVQPLKGHLFRNGIKNLLRRRITKLACRDATRVVAVSKFVHEFLTDKWNIPACKLSVVRYGTPEPIPSEKTVKPSASQFHNEHPFIFTAGSLVPYRGLEDIIRAMAILNKNGYTQKLLIAGAPIEGTFGYEKQMKQMADKYGIASSIVWLGQLSPEEMSWCFYHCDVFVMTSRVEACPNIALEAMSHRCICISADNPPLPEIFDSSSIYYTAGDGENLAETMKTVFAWNDDQRKSMSEKAGRRAAEFSWDVCARRTIATLIKAVNK